MHLRKVRALACSTLVWMVMAPLTHGAQFESPAERARLVELYTSEGCSSCPPADRWLAGLLDRSDLWNRIVPVAFHVTYWDSLGWPDDLARAQYDRRQRRLALENDTGVYTPGIFLNGQAWQGWRKRDGFPAPDETSPGVLSARVNQDQVAIAFESRAQYRRLIAHVAWLTGASTRVKAGENRGRLLRHEFAVERLDTIRLRRQGAYWRGHRSLQRPAPEDSPAIALWVTNAEGDYVQTTGGWLPPE